MMEYWKELLMVLQKEYHLVRQMEKHLEQQMGLKKGCWRDWQMAQHSMWGCHLEQNLGRNFQMGSHLDCLRVLQRGLQKECQKVLLRGCYWGIHLELLME